MVLLQQMIAILCFMLIGYGMKKKNIFDDKGISGLSWFIVNVANPALILSASITMEEEADLMLLGKLFLAACAMYIVMILVSYPIIACFRFKASDRGVFRVMLVFSNIGFMGVPLIQALYGSDALLYASVFGIPFNILMYTYGVLSMQSGSGKMDPGKLLNTGNLACVLTMLIAISGWQAPSVVRTIVTNLSNTTVSISMIVIGATLTDIALKSLFTNTKMLLFSFVKLLVLPVCVLFVVKQCTDSEMLRSVFLIMTATPVAAVSTMLAQQYGCDTQLASRGVALTTILSVVTIPIVSFITGIG